MRNELNKLWYSPTLEYYVVIKAYVLYILLSENLTYKIICRIRSYFGFLIIWDYIDGYKYPK